MLSAAFAKSMTATNISPKWRKRSRHWPRRSSALSARQKATSIGCGADVMDSAILRDSLLDYARIIRARANAFAELPSATDRDRQTLAENEKRLATSVEALVRIVDNHDALVLVGGRRLTKTAAEG